MVQSNNSKKTPRLFWIDTITNQSVERREVTFIILPRCHSSCFFQLDQSLILIGKKPA